MHCTIGSVLLRQKNINIGIVDTENLEDGSVTSGSWRANQGNQGMVDISINIGSNYHSKKTAEIRDKYADYFVRVGAVHMEKLDDLLKKLHYLLFEKMFEN